jgi:hypothetical protein
MLYGKTPNRSQIEDITAESIDVTDVIQNRMLKNPEQLKHVISRAIAHEMQPNRAARDSLIIWLLYLGMRIEELQNLTRFSMDDSGIIRTSVEESAKDGGTTTTETEFQADDNIKHLWNQCKDMTYIEKMGKDGEGIWEYPLCDNKYLFRQILGKKAPPEDQQKCRLPLFSTTIIQMFKKYAEATGKEGLMVPPLNIRLSGVYWKLFEEEQNGKEITHKVLAKALRIKYNHQDNIDIYNKTKKWMTNYIDWKIAFGHM